MKSWKNWPYWLKGGIIGAVLFTPFYFIIPAAIHFMIAFIIGALIGIIIQKKDMRTWIKGGLIGLIISMIIFIFSTYSMSEQCVSKFIPTPEIYLPFLDLCGTAMFFFMFNFIIFPLFIILGAIIGLIVGKIKSKK